MSYIVLARKWRPSKFSQVIGQNHAVKAMCNAIDNNQIHHAWLFTGTRGIGKTTLARIFTKAINCESGMTSDPCNDCDSCKAINDGRFVDLIEVDAASRTGVDSTRELLENIHYSPTVGRYKVYLIDEIHMFSTASFNALLKTLEEPPEHVKFLLATTDPQKLPVTILSRCLQIKLSRLSAELIAKHLQDILSNEAIEFEEPALRMISQAADGSVRDSLSLLDQAIALGNRKVETQSVREMMGLSAESHLFDACMALAQKDGEKLLSQIRVMVASSSQLNGLLSLWMEYFHYLALFKQVGKSALSNARFKDLDKIDQLADYFSTEEIHLLYSMLVSGVDEVNQSPNPAHTFEMLLLRLLAFRPINFDHKEEKNKKKSQTSMLNEVTLPEDKPEEASEKKNSNPTKKIDPKPLANQKKSLNIDVNPKNWSNWLSENQKSFSNLVWQYLKHCECLNVENRRFTLAFENNQKESITQNIQEKISQELSNVLQQNITINIEIKPKNEINSLKSEVEQQFIKKIESASGFQELKKLVGLELIDNSIKLYK